MKTQEEIEQELAQLKKRLDLLEKQVRWLHREWPPVAAVGKDAPPGSIVYSRE